MRCLKWMLCGLSLLTASQAIAKQVVGPIKMVGIGVTKETAAIDAAAILMELCIDPGFSKGRKYIALETSDLRNPKILERFRDPKTDLILLKVLISGSCIYQ